MYIIPNSLRASVLVFIVSPAMYIIYIYPFRYMTIPRLLSISSLVELKKDVVLINKRPFVVNYIYVSNRNIIYISTYTESISDWYVIFR